MTTDLTDPIFHDEDAARAHFEAIHWPNGPFCPKCGEAENVSKLGEKHGKRPQRPGLHHCNSCKAHFTVTVGSVMERSHIPLCKWALGFHLMAASKKGVSAHQLHRMLKITYRAAWFMEHRIREAMAPHGDVFSPIGGEGKTIEIDETFQGYKEEGPTYEFHNERGWQKKRGYGDRRAVVTLVERGGRARSFHIGSVTARELDAIIAIHADARSKLMTDEANAYRNIGKRFASHESVNHSKEEWVRKLSDGTKAHSNTAEGFFSIFKRGMKGVYQHCDEKHLQRYLAEFDFRYSNRIALGVDDTERTERAIRGAVGKRLTYRPSHSA
jgi:transposase-like protein